MDRVFCFLLVFSLVTSAGYAGPDEVAVEVRPTLESSAQNCDASVERAATPKTKRVNARTKLLRVSIVTAGLAGIVGIGKLAVSIANGSPDLKAGLWGAALVILADKGLLLAKRLVIPQLDRIDHVMTKWGYGINHVARQAWKGSPPRTKATGDRVAPDLVDDINARFTLRQASTSAKIGSIVTHLDWLGIWIPEYLRAGRVDEAAAELVGNVVQMCYDNYEIVLRTVDPHIDEVTRELIMVAVYNYLLDKLEPIFKEDPDLLGRFQTAVKKYYRRNMRRAPRVMVTYRDGYKIVLDSWLAEGLKDICEDSNWCIIGDK